MGQKVNPISFRLQVHKNWDSRWFSANKKSYAAWLKEDHEIRALIEKRFASRPTINRIEIERSANLTTITIHTAKAGVVIGRGGAGVTELKAAIEKIVAGPVRINIEDV
ncbi:MAG TPA: KH domain-containing protein, partial [Candidatus Saccharimonadaceae bacterium]|nr:KH domain-containing protein [Candidatus Saccharimonadaceae bacterium]